MGRSFFSAAYTTPVVHVEPEPTYPPYHRWSERQFDPDSEEFFESDDVVYEAVISPDEQTPLATIPALDSPTDVDDSASSDRSSVSDQDSEVSSPTTSGSIGPHVEVAISAPPAPEVVHAVTTSSVPHTPAHHPTSPTITHPVHHPRTSPAPAVVYRYPVTPVPTRSTPTHVRASVTPIFTYGSPSPAPAVTPQLYTWGRGHRSMAIPGSPSARDGPFTNAGARRSFSHIAPLVSRIAAPVV